MPGLVPTICCWGDARAVEGLPRGCRHAPDDIVNALDALKWACAEADGDPVLLVGTSCLPPQAIERLVACAESEPDASIWTALDRNIEALDPLAAHCDIDLPSLDRLVEMMAQGTTWPTRHVSAGLSLWRRPLDPVSHNENSFTLGEAARAAPIVIGRTAFDREPAAAPSVLDPLRARLARSLAQVRPGWSLPSRPCGRARILHIMHSWGGGVAQWARDFAAVMDDREHWFLLAVGDDQGADCGRILELRAGDPDGPVVEDLQLPVSIPAIAVSHAEYRRALTGVIERYAINQIVLSSPIGHALDALEVGLPTLVALHDYVPAWPHLEVRFEGDDRPFDGERLEADRRQAKSLRLSRIDEPAWRELKEAWLERLQRDHITVCAPSQSVPKNLARLDEAFAKLDIQVVGLGTAAVVDAPFYEPPTQRPDRWRIVVPGRINRPKGKQLLLDVLDELTAHADVFLLGAGADGHAFFGRSGVHVIIDYEREQLAELVGTIKPHFALLLSTVSETFSYTLSEMWSMGVPVIASRVGALAERIADDRNGRLFDPLPEDLMGAIRGLGHDDLGRFAQAIRGIELPTLSGMGEAYQALFPPADSPPRGWRPVPLETMRAATLAHEARVLRDSGRNMRRELREQREELGRRASWAYDLRRQLADRTAWAKSLERDVDQAREALEGSQAELAERTRWAHELERELQRTQQIAAETYAELEATSTRLNARIVELSDQVVGLVNVKAGLERELADARAALGALQRDHAELGDKYQQVITSRSWVLTKPLRFAARLARRVRDSLNYRIGRLRMLLGRIRNSLRVRGVRGTAARVAQEVKPRPKPSTPQARAQLTTDYGALRFDVTENPTVSVVIPVYNHYSHTHTCLKSLLETTNANSFEIIVVDDESSDETAAELARHEGITVLRNVQNLGFIGTCNRGAAAAQGQYVVFLNNDTAVADGWIDALVDTFASRPDAGLVGAKLVYPDGRLQEAGGIVFSDASGWNYGRFEDPDHPAYNYVREVDYCSGAAICIPRELFDELGGFDTRYAPAYYEDTDLAFSVRAAGKKVYYQPRSVVTHFEGVTSGTDVSSGTKQYQVVNQEKFAVKWADALARQRPPGGELLRARENGRPRRALIIDACTPEPDKDSGSVRMVNLMRLLREQGYQVGFMADNLAYMQGYSEPLQQLGVEVHYHPHVHPTHQLLEQTGGSLDVVLISRHYIADQYRWALRTLCPNARLLFDTVDLHYLREERLAALEDDPELVAIAARTKAAELAVARDFDATLVVSDHEKRVLAETAPDIEVHVVSNIHEVHGRTTDFRDRQGIMFVGGYQHPPNIDAAIWFAKQIFPLVRARLPEVTFHIIGSRAPPEIRRLGELDGVAYEGFVPEIEPWLHGCRVAVAPLRYGAGVKGKVNSSMSYGQPVVATSPAVEGMFAESGNDVLVADDEAGFADAVVRLYSDPELWARISDGGLANVERHFSFASARSALHVALGVDSLL